MSRSRKSPYGVFALPAPPIACEYCEYPSCLRPLLEETHPHTERAPKVIQCYPSYNIQLAQLCIFMFRQPNDIRQGSRVWSISVGGSGEEERNGFGRGAAPTQARRRSQRLYREGRRATGKSEVGVSKAQKTGCRVSVPEHFMKPSIPSFSFQSRSTSGEDHVSRENFSVQNFHPHDHNEIDSQYLRFLQHAW